jgi:hypothetical protein
MWQCDNVDVDAVIKAIDGAQAGFHPLPGGTRSTGLAMAAWRMPWDEAGLRKWSDTAPIRGGIARLDRKFGGWKSNMPTKGWRRRRKRQKIVECA